MNWNEDHLRFFDIELINFMLYNTVQSITNLINSSFASALQLTKQTNSTCLKRPEPFLLLKSDHQTEYQQEHKIWRINY